MRLSIIIPTLNEATHIAALLGGLQCLRELGHELIVVDGGSRDSTADFARPLCDRLLSASRGRAGQMNAGARAARGEVLWFVHADCQASAPLAECLLGALSSRASAWGRFDVRLSGHQPLLRVVETLMNLRSRLSGIATGDQGLFMHRHLFDAVGGFPEIPLMEDIAMSRLLKRHSAPICLHERLVTSSRRWERDGILRTILLMWRLRFAYWRGVPPSRLAMRYLRG